MVEANQNTMHLARHRFLVFAVAWLTLTVLQAQPLKVLVSFDVGKSGINQPSSELLLSGNRLFGTTYAGGTNGYGTIFSINTDGTDLEVLHSFTADADGAHPGGHLVLAGGMLYGTDIAGTNGGYGTIFRISTNGIGFTVLHTMNGTNDGRYPGPGLILSGSTFYGTANEGGMNGAGSIFSVNTNGSAFTVLHTFSSATEGQNPEGGLVLAGGTLYGTARNGGPGGSGTAFSIGTNGSNFTLVHVFSNSITDGARPASGFVLAGNVLYGTTFLGGAYSDGTVFCMDTNGGAFRVLHSFRFTVDGYALQSDLLLSGDTLYGAAGYGGANTGTGTIFSLNTNGGSFSLLHTFSNASSTNGFINLDGSRPSGKLLLLGNVIYGTTQSGGADGLGTVFALPVVPVITGLHPSGVDVVLDAVNGISGHTFKVLTTTNPISPVSQWTAILTNTLASGGNFSITVPNVFGTAVPQRFFTLQTQ